MIITFSVQNFRSIRERVCLDLRAAADNTLSEYYVYEIPKPKIRVLKMALLYGQNASGKTNVLLALNSLRNFILKTDENKEKPIATDPFALDKDKPTFFEIQFYQQGIVYNYILELNRNAILVEKLTHYPKGKEALIFERKLTNGIDDYSYSWVGAELLPEQRKILELTIQNQSILSKINSIKYSGPIQFARDWFVDHLAPTVKPSTNLTGFNLGRYLTNDKYGCNHLEFFKEQMRNADFLINDIQVKREDIEVLKLPPEMRRTVEDMFASKRKEALENIEAMTVLISHSSPNGPYVLELDEESMGTKRYFEFMGLMCELIHHNRIVPIDEIESSLHIDLQIHFITTFLRNAKQGQLIFTSHNTGLLNERDILRRDAIWITDRNNDGSTKLTSVADYSVRKEHAIDKVYRKGLLGGIPNLGSTLLEDFDESKTKE